MHEERIEIHAIFKGDVQGVGFRATARHLALKLGIVGSVRNLADGGVELYAQGKRSTLQELLKQIASSYGPGQVTDVFTEEVISQHHIGFNII